MNYELSNYKPYLVHIRKKKEANQQTIQGCSVYLAEEYCRGDWNVSQSKWYHEEYANKPAKYAEYLNNNQELKQQIYQLAGQDLGCWCNGQKQKTCHGNHLVELTKEWLSEYMISFNEQIRHTSNQNMTITPIQRYNLNIINEIKSENNKEIKNENKKMVWDKKLKVWQPPNGITLENHSNNHNLLKLPCSLVLQYDDMEWERPAGSYVSKNGYVHFDIAASNTKKKDSSNVLVDNNEKYRKVQQMSSLLPVSKGFLGKLNSMTETLETWEPFVCVVKGRLQHRKTGKYMLSLSDDENTYKIHVGQELYGVIKDKFIDVNDTIKVTQYVSSKITIQRRIIIIYDFIKLSSQFPE